MPLNLLAAYLHALRRRGWRAWATGSDGIVDLHAGCPGQQGIFWRFLVVGDVAYELTHPQVTHRDAGALEARLLEHATHTAAFALIRAGEDDPHPAWQRLGTRGLIDPFDESSPEIELPPPSPALVDALTAALADLDQLHPRVTELVRVLDAFAVDATATAGVLLAVERSGVSLYISLGRPRGTLWSWMSIELERDGLCTNRRTGAVRLAEPDALRVWLEQRLQSAEGRWIAADVRSRQAERPAARWEERCPLLPGLPRVETSGRDAWSDRVEALLAPVPATELGLARLEALRVQADAQTKRALGPDPFWRLSVGEARVRLLVSGDELVPPILWPQDPNEWVARLMRKARGWTPPPDVAALLAEATHTWNDRGIAAWWCADHEELELRVRPADSGELVAWVAQLPFPVQAEGLRERIESALEEAGAQLVLREIPRARARQRVRAVYHRSTWVERQDYQELVARAMAGEACSITLHDAYESVQELVDIAGVEVRVESAEICGPQQVLLRGVARFAAEDGRLPL